MSTRWETLAGDTSQFAVKMSFISDPSEIPVATDMAASWGSFEVWVNGANLCAHVEEGETVEAVHWYLLPLLEWLASNWNPMLHEERLPVRNAGADAVASLYHTRFAVAGLSAERALERDSEWYSWRQRHGLHAAREGGLFPELFLRRWGDKVEASWSNQPPPGSPAGFSFLVPHGRALLSPEDVAGAFYAVMRAAVEQLKEWEPASERLASLLASVKELKQPSKQRVARLNWLFSLTIDGAGSWEAVRRLFQSTSGKVRRAILEPSGTGLVLRGSSHAVLLFGSVSPTIDRSDALALATLLVELFDEQGDSAALAEVSEDVRSGPVGGTPWEQGYEFAERALEALALDGDGSIDIEHLLVDRLGVRIDPSMLSDARLRGVAIAGPQHHPAVIPNDTHPRNLSYEGRRFTLAHELCHLLVDRRAGRRLAIASGPWAPVEIEQRANAFAAYFLMPPDRVQRVVADLSEPLASPAGVRSVAETFGTSPRATLEHLYNLGFLDEFERELLRGTGLGDETFGRSTMEIGG
jgi:Zn-dependent peptidase ImmA (M78 family)